jgi:HlyD family secretion protein
MTKTIKFLIALPVLIIAGIGLSSLVKKEEVTIQTILPKTMNIEKKILVQGTIIPGKEVQVKYSIMGVLEEVFVKVGDQIKEGDNIARVKMVTDPMSYEKLLHQYKSSQVQFENKKRSYDRNKELYQEKVISKPDYELAETQYLVSQNELLAFENELIYARGSKENKQFSNIIKATTDGTVLELPVKVGGAITARGAFHEGTTIATIANLDSMLFYGKILESDICYLKPGMVFDLNIGAIKNKNIKAKLILIAPKGSVTDGSVKFDIYAKVIVPPGFNEIIRASYSAYVNVVLEQKKQILTLDEKYLSFSNDSAFVDLVYKNNKVKKTYVVTGISDGINVEITKGLNKTDKIKVK